MCMHEVFPNIIAALSPVQRENDARMKENKAPQNCRILIQAANEISAFLDSYSSYTKHGLPPEAACTSCICSQHARDCDTTRTANSAAAQ